MNAATDPALDRARSLAQAAIEGAVERPVVKGFFDQETFTISYVVHDPAKPAGGDHRQRVGLRRGLGPHQLRIGGRDHRLCQASSGLTVDWLLETHAHADHLSAAPYLQQTARRETGDRPRPSPRSRTCSARFSTPGTEFARDGSQFDRLLDDGDELMIGTIPLIALHVPGHTPADMAYLIGDALFVGDTMFMPDYGSARADFPGGCARQLYQSVRRLMQLPSETRAFMCHDYKAPGRDQYRLGNDDRRRAHGQCPPARGRERGGRSSPCARRATRRSTCRELILPSIQVNMRGGRLPEPEDNGVRYLKLPIDAL